MGSNTQILSHCYNKLSGSEFYPVSAKIRALSFIIISVLYLTTACSSTPEFYKEHQDEYINLQGLVDSAYNPYIVGKVIALDMESGQIDDVYHQLSSDLRAKSHDEVGMVIWCDWGEKLIGTYSDGFKGYAHTCDITIIDFANFEIVDTKYFKGTDPPETKNVGGDVWGSKPTPDIVEYIEGLPQTLTLRQTQTQAPTVTFIPPTTVVPKKPVGEITPEPIPTEQPVSPVVETLPEPITPE